MPFRFECTFQTLEECIVLMTTIERMLNLSTQPVRYYEWQLTKTGEQAFSRVINDQWQRLYRQQNDRNLFECRHPQYMEWAEKAFPGSVEPSKASKRVLDLQQD